MNDNFLKACWGEPVDRTPIWIMRQAGRYLPEYRELRAQSDFLTMCRTPELATQVTLQPIDRFGMDAAILFSDILIPAEAMGLDFRFEPGPVLETPVRTEEAIRSLASRDPREAVPYVYDTIRMLRTELDGRAPLIGFAAAPFTLAAYLVEGQGSKNFAHWKQMLFSAPSTAHELLERVAMTTIEYVRAQVDAGAQAIQLFDTWAGLLAPREFREFARRYASRVLEGLGGTDVPRIYFALDAAHLYGSMEGMDCEVLGVDWRTPLDRASKAVERRYSLQGNLDPCALFAPPAEVRLRAREVLRLAEGLRGHIFNLGHGILPQTPVEHVEALVQAVREGLPASHA